MRPQGNGLVEMVDERSTDKGFYCGDVVTRFMNDWARTALQVYDALYGHDEQALLQIESILKLIAKRPMFGSEVYNHYVPDT